MGWADVPVSHLGSLWKEAALFQEAEELARLLPDLIEQDQQLDIIGGAAGCIAGLLSLYAVAPSPTMLELATRCGEHLLARAHPMQTGIGWKIPQQEIPLTGFAHGAAGIALSLLRLAAVSRDERFRHAALAAMAYERSLFSPERDNWPDLRTFRTTAQGSQANEQKEPQFMVAWCHGAPGIGLARLASLPYADDAAIRQEIAAALQTTKTQGITAEQSLCHGTAGNLEMLLVASQTLETPPIHEIMRQHSPALLECVPAVVEQKVPSLPIKPLGLMTGLAGI
ncbi:MAG TPA: lanthionine synthetase LanC family protein [Ktedonobacterales bacterium]|nr:lanthionine synthetase LanC family protein [Ktedonobacterales bacterium]